MNIEIELITPEIAKEYMTHNVANRTIKSKHLDEIVRDMKNGNWKLTHQGIAFDRKGNLIDGQHRLMGVILSGATVQMMVTRDLDDGAILNIDNGSMRQIGDVYKIEAALNGVGDDPAIRHKSCVSSIRTLVRCGYMPTLQLTNSEIVKLTQALEPHLRKMYKICITRGRASHSGVYSAVLAALICGESSDDLYKFASVFLNGDTKDCDEFNTAAAFRLATVLMDAKIKHVTLTKEKIYRLSQNAIWQFIHGTETRQLRETKTLRYPVDIVLKSIIGENKK